MKSLTRQLIIIGIVLLIPVGIFIIKFWHYPFSGKVSDWESFAVYVAGTVGTLGSIAAGYLLYRTLMLQNMQRMEQTFFDYFNAHDKLGTDQVPGWFKLKEIEIHQGIETLANTPGVQPQAIIESYINQLKSYFIEGYSLGTATPRVNRDLNNYFKFINSVCILLNRKNFDEEHFQQLRTFFLSRFTDYEIKMICYYYYLFYDIVNSTGLDFICINPVRDSGLFEGNLFFSDDFSGNNDPRRKDFQVPITIFRNEVRALRKQRASSFEEGAGLEL